MAEKRSALIVATSQYEDARLSPLGGPGEDAEALETVLAAADIGGFDVQLSLNDQHDVLRTTLEGFFTEAGRDDLLLVHFSGHGLKDDDGQLYLAAADTRIDRLMSTGIEAGWVNRLMNRSRSEKIALFLDCCFGGAFTTGLARRAGVDTAGAKETFTGTGRFVITASDAMQYSFESGRLVDDASPQPSPFTGALVEGLKSGAADRNEDGFVSINELFDYLEDRVRQLSPAQTPTKSAFNQVGDWVIAQSTRAPTIRILPASVQAHLKSDQALERMTAVIDLRDLIEASDPRLAEAARKALERLTGDDSKAVAAAALRVFGEMPAGQSTTPVPSTPLSESSLPDAIKDALTTEPTPEMTRAAEVASREEGPPVAPVRPEPPARRPGEVTQPIAPSQPIVSLPADPNPVAPVATAASAPPVSRSTPPDAPWGSSNAPSAPPRAGALWSPGSSPAPVTQSAPRAAPATAPTAWVAAPAGTPAAVTAPHGQAGAAPSARPGQGQWSARRAAGRGFLGAIFGFLLAILYDISFGYVYSVTYEVLGGLMIAGLVALVVCGVEKAVPALRIPGGAAYAAVGHNRWIASALLGTVLGILLMVLGGYVVYVLLAIIGFLAAEAVVGRKRATDKTAA